MTNTVKDRVPRILYIGYRLKHSGTFPFQERVPGVPGGHGGRADEPLHGHLRHHLLAGRRDRHQVYLIDKKYTSNVTDIHT